MELRRQNGSITVRGKQALRAIDVFLMRAPDMNVKVQGNIYEVICYSGMLHGVEIWRVKQGGVGNH